MLNGSLYPGRTGNAGALGSMPVPASGCRRRRLAAADPQRLDLRARAAARSPPDAIRRALAVAGRLGRRRAGARRLDRETRGEPRGRDRRGDLGDRLRGGHHRRRLSAEVRRRIVEATAAAIERFDRQGLSPVAIAKAPSARARAPSAAPACRSSPTSRATARCCSRRACEPALQRRNSGFRA